MSLKIIKIVINKSKYRYENSCVRVGNTMVGAKTQ